MRDERQFATLAPEVRHLARTVVRFGCRCAFEVDTNVTCPDDDDDDDKFRVFLDSELLKPVLSLVKVVSQKLDDE